jgi:hypothetical protein
MVLTSSATPVGVFRPTRTKLKFDRRFLSVRPPLLKHEPHVKHDWRGVLFGVNWNSKGILHATVRAVTSAGYFVDNHGSKELWTLITLTRNKWQTTMVSKVILAIMWSRLIVVSQNDLGSTVVIMCPNSDLHSHCCNNDVQQWPRFPLLRQCVSTMISVPIVAWKCVPTTTSVPIVSTLSKDPDHAGCLVPRKNATDRHRRISF